MGATNALYSYTWGKLKVFIDPIERGIAIRVYRLIRPYKFLRRTPKKRQRELWRLVFRQEEPDSTWGWIHRLAVAFSNREPVEMILDFIRDNGLTVEMEGA